MATRTQTTLVAVYSSRSDAEKAADDLRDNGFDKSDIYMSGDVATEYPTTTTGETHHEGGFMHWLKSLFGGEHDEDQKNYETAVRGGRTVLSVQAREDNLDTAVDILNSHSPVDVSSDVAAGTAGTAASTTKAGSTRTATAARGATTAATGTASAGATNTSAATSGTGRSGQSIPVVQEELRVGKRSVMRGGVRVYTRVVEQPVEETVRLREEKVNVERQPVNRPVTDADLKSGRDQTVEVREYAEEPVVAKEARVVEEVRVGKEATERNQTVRDTVRHTEVNVENLKGGAEQQQTFPDQEFRDYYTKTYGSSGNYQDYAPAYRYGYEMANDPRYRGKDFSQVESDLRTDYGRRYPNSTWDKMKDAIRYGWDKVTGRTHTAAGGR